MVVWVEVWVWSGCGLGGGLGVVRVEVWVEGGVEGGWGSGWRGGGRPLVRELSSAPSAAACSVDGHFVFSVAATDAEPPLDPRTLGVRGHPGCLPAVATPDVAVFKIHTAACGARMRVRARAGCLGYPWWRVGVTTGHCLLCFS